MTRASRARPRSAERLVENPFYVLGVRPDAPRTAIEREGQKLLGMLELGLASAATYATPIGPAERTADKVRQALAELRDPDRRLAHELWARLDPSEPAPADEPSADPDEPRKHAPWLGALAALGWEAEGRGGRT